METHHVEFLRGGEDVWKHKVEQRPQLVHVILERRAGDEQLVDRSQLAHSLPIKDIKMQLD